MSLPRFDIEIRSLRALMGPNLHRLRPVVEMVLDVGLFEEYPSHQLEDFVDRLMAEIPSLYSHKCSEGVEGGFLSRMREGTWIGHIIEHIALELQFLAGHDEVFGKTRSTGETGVYRVVFATQDRRVGEKTARKAVEMALALANRDPWDTKAAIAEIEEEVSEYALGPSTLSIVREAERRGIPWIRLNDYNLLQFGHGVHQRRIQATTTSLTGLIATDIACDKPLTLRILQDAGIPVPEGDVARDEEEAVAVARRLGYPLVVKPKDGNQGKGLSLDLRDEEGIRQALKRALEFSDAAVVERYHPGQDYRVLVVNGELVAAARRVPPSVVGDGRRSVAELVEALNQDPRRGTGHEKPLTRVPLNEATVAILAQQGLALDAVPEGGRRVWLRLSANLSTGGSAVDCTDEVHADNADLCVRAARNIGLDIAGIDVVTPDLSVPMIDTGGVIVEVNAAPGFRMHLYPSEGAPRDVASPVVDMLYPMGSPSRVPVVAVTGTNGKTTTARLAAHVLKLAGRKVGLTTSDGIYIDGRPIIRGDTTGPWSHQVVLRNRTADTAVLETARGGILRAGLGYDRCDVAVLTNLAADHLGLGGVNTLEEMAEVKSVVLEVVFEHGYGVLNAEDPLLVGLAPRCPGKVCYFSLDPHNETFRTHRDAGGVGATVEDGVLALYHHRSRIAVLPVAEIPCTFGGAARFNVANALAAALAAWLLGVRLPDLREGLKTFTTSYHFTPGRQNFYLLPVGTVLVDYAHNPHGFRALAEMLEGLRGQYARFVGVLSAPGDRRDEDLVEMGALAAPAFAEVILKDEDHLRGRAPGEVAGLLEQGLRSAGYAGRLERIPREAEAVAEGIRRLGDRDLLVVTVDGIAEVHDLLTRERHVQQI